MIRKILTVTIHVAAWACIFLLPFVFFPHSRDYKLSDAFWLMFVCVDAYLIAFYYLNTHLLIPLLLTKKKWLWYILVILLFFIFFLYIPKLFQNYITLRLPEDARSRFQRHQNNFLYPFTGSSAVFFLVFTVSTCTKVIQQWLTTEKKKKEIETEKVVAELSFLRSQINPHFFFNTLNNIYSLAMVKSDDTADAVMKLSSIMRYILDETKHDSVALEKEVGFIQNYIELQKVRLTAKTKLRFVVEGNVGDKQIAPLLLIPFVENAFKYGVSTIEESELLFSLVATENQIIFSSENYVLHNGETKDNTGIGLKNTRRRLELLYPGRHNLQVQQLNNHFIIHLILT